MTFSARDLGFVKQQQLEVVLHFSLPRGAVVIDSWLWYDDQILEAELIDRWTATQIYESIVNRRRDPSLLTKKTDTQYELRVYPMSGTGSRKVRISYLVPGLWNGDQLSYPLPGQILGAHLRQEARPLIRVFDTDRWGEPFVPTAPGVDFLDNPETQFGRHMIATITPGALSRGQLVFESPATAGVIASRFVGGDEKYFEIFAQPGLLLGPSRGRRIVVVLDHDQRTHQETPDVLLMFIRDILKDNLSERDAFNLVLSRLSDPAVSDHWISGSDSSIDSLFDAIDLSSVAEYSLLPTVLSTTLHLSEETGPADAVILLSSSDGFGDIEVANALISDLNIGEGSVPPIHVVDHTLYRNTHYTFQGLT